MRLIYGLIALTLITLGCNSGGVNTGTNARNPTSLSPTPKPEKNVSEQKVTIDSPDGVKLVGSYYEAGKPMSPALLLLHQWQSDRHSFDDFATRVQARGSNVLSIDGRGFGESTKKADGSTIAAGRTDADVKAMLGDVDAAVNYLLKQGNVDPKRIGIVGASYGSSLAIIYAAEHASIAAVALLSPGLNYFGNMPTEPAVTKYGDRKLILFAAEDDKESADAVRKLDPIGRDEPRYPKHLYEVGGHGTALLKIGAGDEMSDFFADAFDLSNLHLKK